MASPLFMFIALGCVAMTAAGSSIQCGDDSNCARCLPSGICQYCKAGYVRKTKDDKCQKSPNSDTCDPRCTGNCKNSGAGKCDTGSKCAVGFVNHDNACRSCDMNCKLDSGCENSGPGLCDTGCIDGYTLVNKSCKACSDNCASGCSVRGPARCDTTCNHGYALDNSSGVCMSCDERCSSTAGCARTGPHFCDGPCQDGYTLLSPTVPVCAECDSNCDGPCVREGAFRCDDRCRQGFSLNDTTHRCVPCSSNCKSGCRKMGAGLCDSECNPGYYFDSKVNACYPCDSNCAGSCQVSGRGNCDGPCKSPYRLVNSLCVGGGY